MRAADRRIRALRPPKVAPDPWQPLGTLRERERTPSGSVEEVLTAFLAGRECPFTCVFCDLWRHTLDGPTPRGALPAQLRRVLAGLDPAAPPPDRIKLYNASNFFDAGAVPPEDEAELAVLLDGLAALTVESHPRLVGERCFGFAARLTARLEVAMGLETVHPQALPRLNKGMSLDDFDRAAGALAERGIDLRAFVLLGTPFVPRQEQVEWAVCSARHALGRGARHVAIIPVRLGNGELERLAARGEFSPPTLADLEAALERSLTELAGVVTADLWDAHRLASCPGCARERIERLERMNLSGRREPAVPCAACGC